MKAISVADPRNNFAEISAFLLNGEKLVATKRGQAFATLSPAIKRKLRRYNFEIAFLNFRNQPTQGGERLLPFVFDTRKLNTRS